MFKPNLCILYVDSPQQSKLFYSKLFQQTPVHASSTFVMFCFDDGWQFGLWSNKTVSPKSQAITQCMEVASKLKSNKEVDALYLQLQQQKVVMLHAPKALDFGYAFTALDPDGHRLRFYSQVG